VMHPHAEVISRTRWFTDPNYTTPRDAIVTEGTEIEMTDAIDVVDVASTDSDEYSTKRLARLVTETRFEDLPESVVATTRRLILDEIVCTAAATATPMARALYALRADRGGTPEATLIVDGRKVPVASAAYIHGQLANLIDADEAMHQRMHAVSAGLMAGLAVAEMTGASGKELIVAIATGYEISARVGSSLKMYAPDGNGGLKFAPLVGFSWMTLGAAATAGRLLGLDSGSLAHAIGQAFVTTPVYFDVGRQLARLYTDNQRAAWHKYQMSGAMSAAGVEAALLVSSGWLAQEDMLDQKSGFWKSFASPGCDFSTLYGNLGETWYITETSIKVYPFCGMGRQALDLLTDLIDRHKLRPDDIARIDLRVPPVEAATRLAGTVHANESLKLMQSLPTALALIALGVPPGPKWFNADFSSRPLREMAERVHFKSELDWAARLSEQLDADGYFRTFPTEVIVSTTSGKELREFSEFAMGDPWSPETRYDDTRVADKARQYLDGILPPARVEQLIEAVLTVDTAADISSIVQSMVA
jgi:2-methylcitrate dehydratase PrpD